MTLSPCADVASRLGPDGPGWVVITAAALGGERVLWLRDTRTPFSPQAVGLVRYLWAELLELTAGKAHVGPEELRIVHRSKKAFGGVLEAFGPACGADDELPAPPALPSPHVADVHVAQSFETNGTFEW